MSYPEIIKEAALNAHSKTKSKTFHRRGRGGEQRKTYLR